MKEKWHKLHFFCIFSSKYLVVSKKSSTFAPAFERESVRDVVQPG